MVKYVESNDSIKSPVAAKVIYISVKLVYLKAALIIMKRDELSVNVTPFQYGLVARLVTKGRIVINAFNGVLLSLKTGPRI